jgi:hypothetical protein
MRRTSYAQQLNGKTNFLVPTAPIIIMGVLIYLISIKLCLDSQTRSVCMYDNPVVFKTFCTIYYPLSDLMDG